MNRALSHFAPHAPPSVPLATLPTPVLRAPALDGPRTEVWIKKDDESSPVYGGSKVRKLEWLLADPRFDTSRPIVTVGSLGSHHLVALALFLARSGRALHALTFPQPVTTDALASWGALVALGTRFWYVDSRAQLPLAWLAYRASIGNERGTWMEPGATSPVGTLGLVSAGLELAEQVTRRDLPRPEHVFVAGGSGGTPAGLILGFALAGLRTRVHVISTVEPWFLNRWTLGAHLRDVLKALRTYGVAAVSSPRALCARAGVRFDIDYSQVGAGYGTVTAEAEAAVATSAPLGLKLETTYTGRSLAALRRFVRTPDARGPVLFWNTQASTDLTPLFAQTTRGQAAQSTSRLNPERSSGLVY